MPGLGIGRFAAALALSVIALAPRGQAMEGMSGMYNTCMLMAGPHELHLSAYQPATGTDQEFCADVPSTGTTIVTVNAVSPEILNMMMEVRIIRDEGNGVEPNGDLGPLTLAYSPPKNHPSGIVTLPVNFDKTGNYLVLVNVSGGDGATAGAGDHKAMSHGADNTARFVITAGRIMTKTLFVWIVYSGMLLAVLGIFLWVERRRHRLKAKPSSGPA